MEERLPGCELACQAKGVAIAARSGLFHEVEQTRMASGCEAVGIAIAGGHDQADLVDPGGKHLLGDDLKGGLIDAIAVDKSLQRQHCCPGRRL